MRGHHVGSTELHMPAKSTAPLASSSGFAQSLSTPDIVRSHASGMIASPEPPHRKAPKSPLHISAKDGNVAVLRSMASQPGFQVNAQDVYGSTALHLASFMGHADYVRELLGFRDVDPNLRDVFHRSALEHACRQGHSAVVSLLAKHPRINVNQQNKRGETPLMRACSYGHAACAELLLAACANPNLPDGLYRNTALHRSSSKGYSSCVQALIKHGGDLSRKNSDDCNVLHSAVLAEKPDLFVIKILCLHLAGHPSCQECLEAKNKRGLSPMQEAARRSDRSIVQLLEELRSNSRLSSLLQKSLQEWTPFDVSIFIDSQGLHQLSDIFLKHDVNGHLFSTLTDNQLRDMLGISSWGARTKILQARSSLFASQPSSSTTIPIPIPIPALGSSIADIPRHPGQLIPWTDLRILEERGRGYFGSVRRAVWCGIEVAVKTVYRQNFRNQDDLALFRRECDILARLHHPNIVLFLGVSQSPEGENAMVTEFVGRGSLKTLIKDETEYLNSSPSLRYNIACGVANAMVYLHHCSPPIMHRDLTTSNILVNYDGTVKICDFGMSKMFTEDALSAAVGCMTSMAPEVYKGEGYSPSIDVFSYAMVLYEVFVGETPNGSIDQRKYAHQVAMEGYRPVLPASMPIFWQSMIISCWDQNPERRPTFDQIQQRLKDMPSSHQDPSSSSSSSSSTIVLHNNFPAPIEDCNTHLAAYDVQTTTPDSREDQARATHSGTYVSGSGGIDPSDGISLESESSSGIDVFTAGYADSPLITESLSYPPK